MNGGSIERLIIDLKESLEREIHDFRAEIITRLDTQAVRLDRVAGNWEVGRRWSGRMDAWADKVDAALEQKDREIADLRKRLSDLENKAR